MATLRSTATQWAIFTPISAQLANLSNGAGTLAVLMQPGSTTDAAGIGLFNSADSVWYHDLTLWSGTLIDVDDPGNSQSPAVTVNTTNWWLFAVTWAGSGASVERFHYKNVTGGGAWTHVNSITTNGGLHAGPGTSGRLHIGYEFNSTSNGSSYAVAAAWAGTQLTDLQVEELATHLKTSDWYQNSAGNPTCLVECTSLTPRDIGANPSTFSTVTMGLTGSNPAGWTFNGVGAYDTEIDTDSPVAHWKLNETSGNFTDRIASKVLTPSGTVTYNQTGLLTLGNGTDAAAAFPNGHATRANSSDLISATAFSVECWVKPTTANTGVVQTVFLKGDDSVYWTYGLELTAAGKWNFYVQVTAQYTYVNATATPTAVDGATYHVVGTYDGSNIRLYVNGSLAAGPLAAVLFSTGSTENNAAFTLAGQLTTNRMPGTFDEAAYYSTALSGTRVAAHYAAGTPFADTTTRPGLPGMFSPQLVPAGWF